MRVNFEEKMLTDPRFKKLGQRLRISHFEAFGRLFPVWNMAYHRRDAHMAPDDIDALAELEGFAGAMVAAGLATETSDGQLRLRGVETHVVWLIEQDRKREMAARARRVKPGVPREVPGQRSTQDVFPGGSPGKSHGGIPREVPRDVPDQEQEYDQDQDLSSGSGTPRELPDPRASSRADLGDDPAVRARRALADEIWRELEVVRGRVAKSLGTKLQPLHPMDSGRTALAMRILEVGDLAQARERCRHVLAVREAEALAPPGVTKWLTGSMFETGSWRTATSTSVEEAARPRAGPRSTMAQPPTLRLKSRSDDELPPLGPFDKPL